MEDKPKKTSKKKVVEPIVEPKKPRKPRESRSIHGPLAKAVFTLEVPGETVVALHNAIAFTMAHHEQYNREGENCPHCFEAMYTMRRHLQHLIENVGTYQLYRKRAVN